MTQESEEDGRQVIAPQIVIGFRHRFHSYRSSHTRTCIIKIKIKHRKSPGFMRVARDGQKSSPHLPVGSSHSQLESIRSLLCRLGQFT